MIEIAQFVTAVSAAVTATGVVGLYRRVDSHLDRVDANERRSTVNRRWLRNAVPNQRPKSRSLTEDKHD